MTSFFIERAKRAVLLEMGDRRLLNDVDDDLHDEIATAIVAAALGDGVVVPRDDLRRVVEIAGRNEASPEIDRMRAMLQAAHSVPFPPKEEMGTTTDNGSRNLNTGNRS